MTERFNAQRQAAAAEAIEALALWIEQHPGHDTPTIARAHPAWSYRAIHNWLTRLAEQRRVAFEKRKVGNRVCIFWGDGLAAKDDEDEIDPILVSHCGWTKTWTLDHPVGPRTIFELALHGV